MFTSSLLLDSLYIYLQLSIYTGTTKIRLEDVDATSLTLNLGSEEEMSSPSPGNIIHYRVWHRKGQRKITEDMNCALVSPNTRFVISRLTPATEYFFKVVSFRSIKETRVEKNQHLYKNISREETSSSTKEKKLAKKLCLEKAGQYRFQTEVSDLVWLTRQCRWEKRCEGLR